MSVAAASLFDHLDDMTDERGLFEHAEWAVRRIEHGYCTDDNARMLVVTSREPDAGVAGRLGRVALRFTLAAQSPDGRTRNRMDRFGTWTDRPTTEDCWGRSMWGLGVAAAAHEDPAIRTAANAAFVVGTRQRSSWPRAMAFAGLGAAEILAEQPSHDEARALLRDAANAVGEIGPVPWRWPEPRLAYANAVLAEATIAAGAALDDSDLLDRGLTMLEWLLERQTRDGHLSVTAVGGTQGPDAGPQFDQQPIEVAALADACWRAATLTGRPLWSDGVAMAARWFEGDNDSGAPMRDLATGGGFDGLRIDGVNLNQGAESTLALISTVQRAGALHLAPSA